MTPIADMVERMFEENAPNGAVLTAIRAIETVTLASRNVTPASRVTKRDQARDRKQKQREREKLQRKAEAAQANDGAGRHANVTRDSVTETTDATNVSIKEGLSVGKDKKERKTESARARGTRLSPNQPLSAEHRALIVAEGIIDPERLWTEFVDYWSDIPGQRGKKLNWTGTLRNRCRQIGKGGNHYGNRTANPRASGHDAILAVATRKARELDRNNDMAGAADTAGFAFGDGIDCGGSNGDHHAPQRDHGNHHRVEPDDQRIREGEIIPPDKNAAGHASDRRLV